MSLIRWSKDVPAVWQVRSYLATTVIGDSFGSEEVGKYSLHISTKNCSMKPESNRVWQRFLKFWPVLRFLNILFMFSTNIFCKILLKTIVCKFASCLERTEESLSKARFGNRCDKWRRKHWLVLDITHGAPLQTAVIHGDGSDPA